MAEEAFFSVIIPTLNEEDYLPRLLSDFTKQKLKNFSIILVDANSMDKTKEKALKFSKFYSLQFYTVKKKNVSYQRNFGAQKAKGVYLLFLDADARIDTTFTENLYKNILKKKELLFLPTLITENQSSKNRLLFKIVNSTIKLSQSLTKPLSAGGSIFITRKLFADLKGFKENLYTCEDHNLIQRARNLGIKAKILGDVKVVFSLRRIKKEGEAVVLYKYLLSSIYMLINGEITDKIYTYEMGGGKYKNLKREPTRLRKFLKKTSAFLTDSLS
jgi:glycosyltransferase involved in cell wall biosynthesis